MTRFALLAVLFSCLPAALASAAATPAEEFERGVSAYRGGDHTAALEAFESARAQGLDTPQLQFNLGLCYYKLHRYPDARIAFERLRSFAGYESIADFHLGLVAARTGDRTQAAERWREVAAASDPDMRQRAGAALGRLSAGGPRRGASAYVLTAVGRDTNPALLDEDLQGGDAASNSTELFGAFDYRASDRPAATVLQGGAYLRNYAEDNGFDQHGVFAGLGREHLGQRTRGALSLDAAATWLDGEPLTRTVSVGAQTGPATRHSGLGLKGQLSRIAAPAPRAHLEGWRALATAEWTALAMAVRSRLGYTFEFNDREDLAVGNEFFSHSPMRHRFDVVLSHPAGARWSLRWNARYRFSRYRDPNRFDDGGTLREERREEDLLQAGVQVRRQMGSQVSGLLEYQFSQNRSTLDALDYERHVTLVGVEWIPDLR